MLKPVESLAFKLRFHRHILDVETPAELQRIYDKVDDLGVLMLQERIPGGEDELWTVGSYLDAESRPLAVFTGHKLRQYPHAGGSCLAGVSSWDDELADAALRLLQELALPRRQPGGVQARPARRALLPDGGQRAALEVARAGRASAASTSRYAAYRDAIGDPYIAPRQQDGVKWIVANKDVPLALLEIARRQRSAPEYLRSLRGDAHGRPARAGRPAARPAERRDASRSRS